MAGLKAVFLKRLSMTAYAMGRYAITRRKTRAGAVVPRIHARRSVVALIAGESTTPMGSLSQQERDKPPAFIASAPTRTGRPSSGIPLALHANGDHNLQKERPT